MTTRKIPVAWQTGAGGSGVSVFYSPNGSDPTVELGTFFNAVKVFFPTAVTWNIPSSGDLINEATGQITGLWTAGTAASISGTLAQTYAAGTGAYVRWQTSGIANGRRVRGRTFLCPLTTASYQADGTILDSTVTALNTAVSTLAAAGKLDIWHRPTAPGAADGAAFLVTAGQVPDKVTSLRSRRV